MPPKVYDYAQLADQTAGSLTRSYEDWTNFLNTASRLYKYPFADQLLIYAQRPDATACASYDLWNSAMRRYVRRGAKGIALLDTSGDYPKLRYVFDASDTGTRINSRDPYLWQLEDRHRAPVSQMLAEEYLLTPSLSFSDTLEQTAAALVQSYWQDHAHDILDIVDGSFLEEYDNLNVGAAFRSAATASVAYTLQARCGVAPEERVPRGGFTNLYDWNTPDAVAALGTAVSACSEQALRQIERTVKTIDRERSEEHDRTELHEERGLPVPEPDDRAAGDEAAGQVREDAQSIPEGTSPNPVQPSGRERNAERTPDGNRRDGAEAAGADDDRTGGGERSDGEPESLRSDEVGGADEQLQGSGRGNDSDGTYLQLTLPLFPTEEEQIRHIDTAESVKAPSAFTFSQDDIDAELRYGSGIRDGKLRIHALYQRQPDAKTAVDFLKDEYGRFGHSMTFLDGSHGFADYSPRGLQLRNFETAAETSLRWNAIEKRLRTLVAEGSYLSEEEKAAYASLERDYAGIPGGVPMPHARVRFPAPQMADPPQPVPETAPEPTPASSETLQAAIDDALREWNGDIASKQAVVRYMKDHARDKGTAEWLKQEYGDDLPTFPVTSVGASTDLPWSNVQRRIAQLIREDRFFTDAEQDRFDNIDPIALREALVERGVMGEADAETQADSPFIRQVKTDVEEIAPEIVSEPVAVYPAEQNRLPFDVVVERLHVEPPERAEPPQPEPQNYHITDDHLGEGGAKTKYGYNVAAIRTLKQIEQEGRTATPEEQEILSRYVGWGGIPQAFDARNDSWSGEYAELKALLTPEEYDKARASTLNAHYTSPTVIKAIYEAVGNMGFRTGNILEPSMGIGNFFGLLPESMKDSRLYGVELDSITGRIARQLYPKADITVAGFETTNRKDFYDLAIGNIPFGAYKLPDRQFDRYNFLIHDYFFAKALDQVRPGGVIAFVTSKGTMDKRSPDVRRYIAQRAELLGAIRLPNNAFKANANTEVTTDILFLQKRDRPIDIEPDWVHLGQTEDGIPVNSYFVEHPEMLLGHMAWDDSMYGSERETACLPIEGKELAAQLAEAVKHIEGQYAQTDLPNLAEGDEIDDTVPADPDVKNYSYAVISGEVYYRENSVMVRQELNATAKERVKGLVALRDCTQRLIDAQLNDESDARVGELQKELNTLYDGFTAKYGLINSRANGSVFSSDSSYYLLCSLEVLNEKGELERKADMFSKRTILRRQPVERVDTAVEALAVSVGERAGVDLGFMASLMGGNEKIPQIVSDLQGVIFKDPASGPFDFSQGGDHWARGWQTSDEYLSGNVREKLKAARAAAEMDASFSANVRALEAVQPKDLDASEIDVRLGATWISPEYVWQFMHELLATPYQYRRKIGVTFSSHTAEWNISNKSLCAGTVQARFTYGTERISAYKIIEDALNLRDTRVFDAVRDVDGTERRVLNAKETMLAQQKQQAIKEAFREWVWKDADRRRDLVRTYNERFNSIRPREYDGSHIVFAGMNPEISLREHQRNAIAHVLYGGNTLLAHEVGAGKTFEMVAAAMESKRLGLCQKSMFVVPNHLTEQWASEFLRLYPSANILVTTKKDFEKANRKKFCARIATGDYDAIIMGHSQFERIPISQERQERLLREQIADIAEGIEELKEQNGERFSIKQLERTKKQLEARLNMLTEVKKDDVVTFEQLGVDRLYVDEAHAYKNLFLYTKMRNVAGLSTSEAQKSTDMFLKCRYMDELTGGKGVVFATGTPVSNSMTELYTMQRYLQYGALERAGMTHFDAWASTFGETVTAIELAPEGYNF